MEHHSAVPVDELGRIRIPSEIRRKLGWTTTDQIAIYHVDKNTLILQLADKDIEWESSAIFMTSR